MIYFEKVEVRLLHFLLVAGRSYVLIIFSGLNR